MMHYFDMVLPYFINEEDRSYPHPALQLAWRLDDLVDRLAYLKGIGAPSRNGYRLSTDDIRYALAEDLHTLRDVKAAIGFAKEDIEVLYGIMVDDARVSQATLTAVPPSFVQLTLLYVTCRCTRRNGRQLHELKENARTEALL